MRSCLGDVALQTGHASDAGFAGAWHFRGGACGPTAGVPCHVLRRLLQAARQLSLEDLAVAVAMKVAGPLECTESCAGQAGCGQPGKTREFPTRRPWNKLNRRRHAENATAREVAAGAAAKEPSPEPVLSPVGASCDSGPMGNARIPTVLNRSFFNFSMGHRLFKSYSRCVLSLCTAGGRGSA